MSSLDRMFDMYLSALLHFLCVGVLHEKYNCMDLWGIKWFLQEGGDEKIQIGAFGCLFQIVFYPNTIEVYCNDARVFNPRLVLYLLIQEVLAFIRGIEMEVEQPVEDIEYYGHATIASSY